MVSITWIYSFSKINCFVSFPVHVNFWVKAMCNVTRHIHVLTFHKTKICSKARVVGSTAFSFWPQDQYTEIWKEKVNGPSLRPNSASSHEQPDRGRSINKSYLHIKMFMQVDPFRKIYLHMTCTKRTSGYNNNYNNCKYHNYWLFPEVLCSFSLLCVFL